MSNSYVSTSPVASPLRPLTSADLPAILHIQRQCYAPHLVEAADVLISKITVALAGPIPTAWGAENAARELLAYAIAYPLNPTAHPPRWNVPTHPEHLVHATHLYIHDIAVSPAARRQGLAERLMAQLLAQCPTLNLAHAALVAVQGAHAYWQQQGFTILPSHQSPDITSFGDGAIWMQTP